MEEEEDGEEVQYDIYADVRMIRGQHTSINVHVSSYEE